MAEFIEAAATTDLPEGGLKKIFIHNHTLLLARSGGRYYCTDNNCPHLGGDLSNGTLQGSIIICPMHHSQFDLRTGEVIRWTDLNGIKLIYAKKQRPPRPLKVYPVKTEGPKILVNLGQ
ncbi:MAG TPA: Rieske 2Fe-2S domain-containing protein [Nitrospirota bacterium]|nr:Rieske 2Fe-2S domain-containing protein [Nitrospirota bacterium]